MLGNQDTNYDLISAVRKGRLERVRELISYFGLSYSQAWSEGYVLLRDAVENKHTEVAKLLLTNGSKVNSKNQKSNTPLHFAAINGDTEIVKMLLARGANIDAQNDSGETPLHSAVKSKKTRIIELLLNQGAYVNAKSSCNTTPLHLAIEKGSNEEMIKLLLNRGANVNAQGRDGRTVLHIAVKVGNLCIIEHLLKHGAYLNSACSCTAWKGYTPLYFAERGHEKVVKLFLENGASVDAEDKDDITALHIAVKRGYLQIVEHLLKYGAYVNSTYTSIFRKGNTPLYYAVEKGHEKIVKLLLEYGANVDARDKDVYGYGKEHGKIVENLLQYGFTVNPKHVNNCEFLYAAVEKGLLKIVEELLKYNTDVNMLYNAISRKGYMLLHVATKNEHEEVTELLISYGADVNTRDETGKTPIFYAIENADLKITKLLLTNKANVKDNPELLNIAVQQECREIVEVLLQHGADVNTSDKYGRTALHFTALCEDEKLFRFLNKDSDIKREIAKLLLSRGASVNAQTKDGITTLHAAAQKGYMKIVETLLKYNADVNSTDKTDITPLHIAAQANHLEVVEVLLKFGASIDSKDEYGRTALHIASEEGHAQIVKALLEYGSDINIMSKKNYTPLDHAMAGTGSIYNKGYYYSYYYSFDYDGYYNYNSRRGICSNKVVAEVLKYHIVKMKTANLYVNVKNLLSIFYSNYEIRGFQNECEKEIASMKSENIGNSNASFYDILIKSINPLAILLENESIQQILRSDDYKIKFPIYAGMINSQFRKGERRKELLEQVNKNCYNIFPELLCVCTQKVLGYLSDEDLRILIDACQPTNVSSLNTNVHDVAIASSMSETPRLGQE